MSAAPLYDASEAALAARWHAGGHGPLRLRDGRPLRVIFPGVPGAGHGPDVRDALLDAGGDYLKGDVEFHLLASGWAAHGHRDDPAYAGVVLHVVAHDDLGAATTRHGVTRDIPLLVLPPPPTTLPAPGFVPPCAFAAARGDDFSLPMRALALRRLRMKAARISPASAPGDALYTALLRTLGGPANGDAFVAIASALPLAALLERASEAATVRRGLALTALLKGALDPASLKRAGMRPSAAPERRLEASGALLARLWPSSSPAWPAALTPGAAIPRTLQGPGVGRALAIELAVNALLPVALATRAWPEAAVEGAWLALPSPGVYGHLRSLESWLSAGGTRPFRSAATLQAGLLLHSDYCSRGRCGRCPMTER